MNEDFLDLPYIFGEQTIHIQQKNKLEVHIVKGV